MSLLPDDEGRASVVFPGPSLIGGSGAAAVRDAPVGASYLVASTEPGLTSERVLTAGTQVVITDGGAGGALTIGADAVASPDHLDFPGQNGNIAATVIAAAAPAGVYMLIASATVSVAAAVGTLSAEAQYTNNGAQVATAFTGFSLTATGTTAGQVAFQHTGGDITVTATTTGLVGVPTYEAKFRLVRLN